MEARIGQTSENLLLWADDTVEFAQTLTPLVRVGVVELDDVATARCELMRDSEQLRECISEIYASGDSHPELGLRESLAMLKCGEYDDAELEGWVLEELCPPIGSTETTRHEHQRR